MNNNSAQEKSRGKSQSRRTWNHNEEQQLIEALKELVARGYKFDNGFRTGYLHLLEHYLAQRFPGTDLKAEPHISSKLHNWKKSYNALSLMFGTSGIGLGPTFMIDVQDDVWENYIKKDPSVRTMRFKTWPFFNDWVDIFGKDRATGESAQGFADAMRDFLNIGNTEPLPKASTIPSPTNNEESDTAFTSKYNAESSNTSKMSGKSKCRRIETDDEDPFIVKVSEYCRQNDRQLGDIASKIGEIASKKQAILDPSEKRMKVYNMLDDFEFPCLEARVYVARYLCNNESDLDFFFSIPDDAKKVLVKDILDKV